MSAPDIPGYRVTGILGSGGFATVYRGWQLAVGREVAIKVDNRVLLTDRDRRRFYREVHSAGRLSGHPHVIDVYDAGTLADGRPYLVMELCPAGSLNDALQRHGPMPPAQVRDIGMKIADALAAAHQAGVLHRDIKPANILINRYGLVGLSDFGLASIIAASGEQTASREALTPAFASPETFRWEEPTALADVYSLAATLYALLAGRPPRFPADGSPGPATIMRLHHTPVEDVPGAPPELTEVLRAGLATDPGARPPGAAALRDALVALPPGPAIRGPEPDQPPAHSPGQPARPGGSSGPTVTLGQPRPQAGAVPGPDGAAAGPGTGPGRELDTSPAPAVAGWQAAALAPSGASYPPDPAVPTGMGDLLPPASAAGSGFYPDGAHAAQPGAGAGYGRGNPEPPETYVPGQLPAGGRGRGPGGRRNEGRPGGWPMGTTTRQPVSRSQLAVAGLLAVLVAAGVVVGLRFIPHSGHPSGNSAAQEPPTSASPSVPSSFGIRVTTSNCPAASVKRAGARCPAEPECWNGLVVISGSTSISPLPCDKRHVYQTFAIAILPPPVRTFDQNLVQANKIVKSVCSTAVLLRSRAPGARRFPGPRWSIDVLPPSEAAFDSGARAYRCIARIADGTDLRGSAFGR